MYIIEMSEKKYEIENDLRRYRKEFLYHMYQVFVTETSRNHHIGEIFSFYSSISKFRHNNKLPSYNFIYNILWNSWQDIKENIFYNLMDFFTRDCGNVDYDIDQDSFFNFVQEYIDWLCKELSTKGSTRLSSVGEKINELLIKYRGIK